MTADQPTHAQAAELVLSASSVCKKFCRNIRYSMWYGTLDLLSSFFRLRLNRTKLRKHEFWAVRDVDLQVERGTVLGILGLNGSGKTTLMRLICGIYPFEAGRIEVHGKVASLFAITAGMQPLFSGRENIFLRGTMFGLTHRELREKEAEIIAFSELGEFIEAPLGSYSQGMKARLSFSIAVHTDPDLLIVDEGLAVGDVAFRHKCFQRIREMGKNTAIIFISHNLYQVSQVANRLAVLEGGKKILETDRVSAGIDEYVQRCVRGNRGSNVHTSEGMITSVEVLGAKADQHISINYPGDLTVKIGYELAPEVREAEVVLKFHNEEQLLVAESRSGVSDFALKADGLSNGLQVALEQLPLNPGLYYLSVALELPGEGISIAQANYACEFQVTGFFASKALTHVPARWHHVSATQAHAAKPV